MAIENTTDTTPKSLVCPHCKAETGVTKESVLDSGESLADFYCPHCQKLVFSCKPEIAGSRYTNYYQQFNYDSY
jgi:transposase-like protein